MTVSKIIGPDGGADYAEPSLWFAFMAAVGGTGIQIDDNVGNCQATEIVVTAMQSLAGVTPGAFTILLTAGAGNSFVDNASKLTNAQRYNASNGSGIRKSSGSDNLFDITCANFSITRLQLKRDTNYNGVVNFIDNGMTGRVIDKCIIAHAGALGQVVSMVGASTMTNSLIYTTALSDGIRNENGNCVYHNVTLVTNSAGTGKTGFIQLFGAPLLKNVAVSGFAANFSGTAGTCANNATDLGSFSGTNYDTSGQVSLVPTDEWENVGAGTEDYRTKSTSAKLKDNGTPTGTPTVDIVGTARSGSPTIGSWEVAGGAAPSSRKSWVIQ